MLKIKAQYIIIGVAVIITIIYIIRSRKKDAGDNSNRETSNSSQNNIVNNNSGGQIKIPAQQKYPGVVLPDLVAEIAEKPVRKNPIPTYIAKKMNPAYSKLSK